MRPTLFWLSLFASFAPSLACGPTPSTSQEPTAPVADVAPTTSAVPRAPAPAPLDRFPLLPLAFSIHERRDADGVEITRYEERCVAELPVVRCSAVALDGTNPRAIAHLRIDARGLVSERTDFGDGVVATREPPTVLLPATPTPGMRWTEEDELRRTLPGSPDSIVHEKVTGEITAAGGCVGGVEVTRTIEHDDGARRRVKTVYCPGLGEVSGSVESFGRPGRPAWSEAWRVQSERP